jgi:hypothetical protein
MFVWKKSTSFVQLSARARLHSSGYFASIVIIFASRRCVASGDFPIRTQQRIRRAEGQPAHADFPRARLQNLDGAPFAASSNEDDGFLRRRFALVECPQKALFFQGAVLHGENLLMNGKLILLLMIRKKINFVSGDPKGSRGRPQTSSVSIAPLSPPQPRNPLLARKTSYVWKTGNPVTPIWRDTA